MGNVGGHLFCTSIQTLMTGDTMLSVMFSKRMPLNRDKDGYVFIDRDGKHFRIILNFLRDGFIPRPSTNLDIKELKIEAEFYSISKLVKVCEDFQKSIKFGNETVRVWKTVLQF